MSHNNSRNRQTTQGVVSAGSLIGAAVGVVVGLAAVEHANARAENRESLVQGVLRWVREDVLELPSRQHQPHAAGAAARRILTRSDISALPVRTLVEDDFAEPVGGASREASHEKAFCVICHDPYGSGDSLMRLPCFHEYHTDCIKGYLESTERPLCPVCRFPVSLS